jgi:hypothetical protein
MKEIAGNGKFFQLVVNGELVGGGKRWFWRAVARGSRPRDAAAGLVGWRVIPVVGMELGKAGSMVPQGWTPPLGGRQAGSF